MVWCDGVVWPTVSEGLEQLVAVTLTVTVKQLTPPVLSSSVNNKYLQ